jgi:methyl coenzyme M reductase subunit D
VAICSIHVIGEQMDEEMEQKMSELTMEQKTSNMNKLNESSHELVTCGPTTEFGEFIQRHHCIRDRKTHSQL